MDFVLQCGIEATLSLTLNTEFLPPASVDWLQLPPPPPPPLCLIITVTRKVTSQHRNAATATPTFSLSRAPDAAGAGISSRCKVKHYTGKVWKLVTRSPCGRFMDTPCWHTKNLPIQEKQEGFSRITFQLGVCVSLQSDCATILVCVSQGEPMESCLFVCTCCDESSHKLPICLSWVTAVQV